MINKCLLIFSSIILKTDKNWTEIQMTFSKSIEYKRRQTKNQKVFWKVKKSLEIFARILYDLRFGINWIPKKIKNDFFNEYIWLEFHFELVFEPFIEESIITLNLFLHSFQYFSELNAFSWLMFFILIDPECNEILDPFLHFGWKTKTKLPFQTLFIRLMFKQIILFLQFLMSFANRFLNE